VEKRLGAIAGDCVQTMMKSAWILGGNLTSFINKIWTIAKLCTHSDCDTVEVDESEKPHLCLMWLSHWMTCRAGVCTTEKPISILSRQYRLSASHPFS